MCKVSKNENLIKSLSLLSPGKRKKKHFIKIIQKKFCKKGLNYAQLKFRNKIDKKGNQRWGQKDPQVEPKHN